jgi:hypothetical protein
MTLDEFINRLENITQTVETGADGAWNFAAERTLNWLRERTSGTNLSNSMQYQIEGTLFSIIAPSYILYQNYGVAGATGNVKGARPDEFSGGYTHKYGLRRPPASVFSTYTTNTSQQFAIATNVYKFGIRPKGWFNKDLLTQTYVDYANQFINDNI